MKIGIDARLMHETGVGRYIRALISNLSEIDRVHEFIVFIRSLNDLPVLTDNWQAVLVDIQWHTLQEQLEMPKIYDQAKLDLLHIPYFSVPIFTHTPFIVTIHDLTISHFSTGKATTLPLPLYLLKRLGYAWVLKNAVTNSKAVITVSNTVREQLIEDYRLDPKKIFVTHESGEIETTQVKSGASEIKNNYILYVGNAHPHKNLEILIDAFSRIAENFPNLKLVLIGKIDYFYKRLQHYVPESIAKRVLFPGEISNSEISSWYKHSRIFVFPSKAEGFGIPGLEAMTLQCPVIASDIGVFHEIYGLAALYFNPQDHIDLSQKIQKLLTDDVLCRLLITKGREQAQKFSWAQMSKETLAIYESCLSLRSR